jgi:hypothetical protein
MIYGVNSPNYMSRSVKEKLESVRNELEGLLNEEKFLEQALNKRSRRDTPLRTKRELQLERKLDAKQREMTTLLLDSLFSSSEKLNKLTVVLIFATILLLLVSCADIFVRFFHWG